MDKKQDFVVRQFYGSTLRVAYRGFGETRSAAGWAKAFGLPRNSTWRQLKKGRSPEEIATAKGVKYPPEKE